MSIVFFKKVIVVFRHFRRKLPVMNKISTETKHKAEPTNLSVKMSKEGQKPQQNTRNLQFEVLQTPIKSESDKKEYRVIRLQNGLTACLISDVTGIDDLENEEEEESDETEGESEEGSQGSESGSDDEDEDAPIQKMAAASLSVGVGSFSDPKNVPGMAHFLEHMVFMGSEKFPEENDFDAFLSQKGGSDNASTDCEITTFYFECLEKDLYTALDKFAQFFISPLMKKSSISREREAIDSEFQMAVPSDPFRKEQLMASFAKSESPVNTFTWGNLTTLKDNIPEDELYAGVHEFRNRHYSAHRMTLAIQARLPMEMLEAYVLECFSAIPTNNLPPDDFKQFNNVFDTPKFCKMYYILPVREMIQLEVTWAMPCLFDKYKCKPHQYISWLIGDEGKGSLLAYLKKKVWVLGLTAGNAESGSEHNSMYSLFNISMTLTKDGLDHICEVIETIYSYIKILKADGHERPFKEMKLITDISFKFESEESAVEIVEELSEAMQIYPPEHYITGSTIFYEYNAKDIQMIVDAMVPEKMNVVVFCNNPPNNVSFNMTEQWFGTKYAEQDIPKDWLNKWKSANPLEEFTLPPPNIYLTEDFTILAEDANHPEYPEKILNTDTSEVWYRKDQKFKLPIAHFNFYFMNVEVVSSPKMLALLDLYVNTLQIVLDEEAYPAQSAHLTYHFRTYDKGMIFVVSGYNQKLHLLIELITKYFINFNENVTKDMFEAVKEKLLQHYYNCLLKPAGLAGDIRLNLLIDNHSTTLSKYNAGSYLTYEELKVFSGNFISNVFIKSLVQGNVSKDHTINVINKLLTSLKCKPCEANRNFSFRVIEVPKGESFCVTESFNINDSNSIITNYYQTGPYNLRESVILEILMLIIQEPLFDTLRTKEQLGYDVECTDRDTFGILGYTITVNTQASKNTTHYVNERIEEFLNQVSELLSQMEEDEFKTIKTDLIKTKQCGDTHLKQEVSRNWSEIIDSDYMFDKVKKEIGEIENVRLDDIRTWWAANTLGGNKSNFRKLSIQVSGFTNTNEETQEDLIQERRSHVELKFLDDKELNAKSQDSTKLFIKDIADFKKSASLYPVVCKLSHEA